MKTSTILGVALIIAAIGAGFWLYVQRSGTSTSPSIHNAGASPPPSTTAASAPPVQSIPSPRATAEGKEPGPDEIVEKEMQIPNVPQQMEEWSKQGVTIFSISGPHPQPDGTTTRLVHLKYPPK
jgi:hypothetical protein